MCDELCLKVYQSWRRDGLVLSLFHAALRSAYLPQRNHPLQGGASCGVVGRTGSGKSSLMLALFRLIDVTRGRVTIGGIDTASIGLNALRSQLAIIPQVSLKFKACGSLFRVSAWYYRWGLISCPSAWPIHSYISNNALGV